MSIQLASAREATPVGRSRRLRAQGGRRRDAGPGRIPGRYDAGPGRISRTPEALHQLEITRGLGLNQARALRPNGGEERLAPGGRQALWSPVRGPLRQDGDVNGQHRAAGSGPLSGRLLRQDRDVNGQRTDECSGMEGSSSGPG